MIPYNNLLTWLNTTARTIGVPNHSLAKKRNGDVIKGYYHKLKQNLHAHVIQEPQGKLEEWGLSCGCAMQVVGNGEGLMTFESIIIGPFRD